MSIWDCLFPKWEIVWTKSVNWTIHYYDEDNSYIGDINRISYYEIYFSKKRNQYKIECKGYKPKKHQYYETAVEKLNEFRNGKESN